MLWVEKYRVGVRGKVILSGVQLELPCPGLGVIEGAAGSGKSLLLAALAGEGVVEAEGRVRMGGRALSAANRPLLATREPSTPRRTLEQVLAAGLPRRLDGSPRRAVREALLRWDVLAALRPHLDRPLAMAPHALRRLVGTAQALLADPAVLLLDDPLEGADALCAELHRRVVEVERERRGVLIAARDPRPWLSGCERHWVLDGGQLRRGRRGFRSDVYGPVAHDEAGGAEVS